MRWYLSFWKSYCLFASASSLRSQATSFHFSLPLIRSRRALHCYNHYTSPLLPFSRTNLLSYQAKSHLQYQNMSSFEDKHLNSQQPVNNNNNSIDNTSSSNVHNNKSNEILFFGPYRLYPEQIFYESELSYGIVNLKPLVPGHVLIIPKRICPRFTQLTAKEVSDLYATVHFVTPLLEQHYQASASNIAMQDGKDAGQSVPHVHVHILPRKQGDFQRNDEIHELIDKYDARLDQRTFPTDEERKPRSLEEMASEANELRQFIQQSTQNN